MAQPQTTQAHAQQAAVIARPISIDAVDLMFELGKINRPDPFIDQVVEVLFSRGDFRRRIVPSEIRFNSWLASEVRPYTAGGGAMHVLAHKLGYRLSVVRVGDRHEATAWDVNTRRSRKAVAHLEGAAGILALLRMAYGDRHG